MNNERFARVFAIVLVALFVVAMVEHNDVAAGVLGPSLAVMAGWVFRGVVKNGP